MPSGATPVRAIVQAPRALPRVIRLPREICEQEYAFVFLSSILHAHVHELFTGMTVQGCSVPRHPQLRPVRR